MNPSKWIWSGNAKSLQSLIRSSSEVILNEIYLTIWIWNSVGAWHSLICMQMNAQNKWIEIFNLKTCDLCVNLCSFWHFQVFTRHSQFYASKKKEQMERDYNSCARFLRLLDHIHQNVNKGAQMWVPFIFWFSECNFLVEHVVPVQCVSAVLWGITVDWIRF